MHGRSRDLVTSFLLGAYSVSNLGFYDSKEYPDQLECLLQIWLSSMNLFAVHERF